MAAVLVHIPNIYQTLLSTLMGNCSLILICIEEERCNGKKVEMVGESIGLFVFQ